MLRPAAPRNLAGYGSGCWFYAPPFGIFTFNGVYLSAILDPDGFGRNDRKLAEEKGFMANGQLVAGVKATVITDWLKQEFELGHGHAMAIYATFKGKKE